ncbi:hypothetical protein HDU76_002764, partial [Blyttiomyces sp. JEL0837]
MNRLEGIKAYAQINMDAIFEDFVIQSMNADEIWLEIGTEYWLRVLRSVIPHDEVQGRNGKVMTLVQDIPVRVLTKDQTADLNEPVALSPEVNIMMPSLQGIRSIADRMKAVDEYVILSANLDGDFQMLVESNSVKVETTFRKLTIPQFERPDEAPEQTRKNEDFASIRLGLKDFFKFTNCITVCPLHTICCIHEEHMAVIFVYFGGNDESGDPSGIITY